MKELENEKDKFEKFFVASEAEAIQYPFDRKGTPVKLPILLTN